MVLLVVNSIGAMQPAPPGSASFDVTDGTITENLAKTVASHLSSPTSA